MPERNLYAVLCAINKYRWPVSELSGCINDAEEWLSLLTELEGDYNVFPCSKYDENATKAEVLKAFQKALVSAGENDVVFFFYSGHGARENSHDVFENIDSDGAFETLVCYDGITYDGDLFEYNLVSDKELHYLMSKYATLGTHVVVVLDSCHSGNITRNSSEIESDEIKKRQFVPPKGVPKLSMQAPQRSWSEFVFGQSISEEMIREKGWFQLLPQAPHIAMSACLNDESAYEVHGHGIFTRNMIKVLKRTRCEISYRSLQARVRQFVHGQMNQTPEIYSAHRHPEDLLLNFLDKEGIPQPFRANCYYAKSGGWMIDMGSLHGMRKNSGPILIERKQGNITATIKRIRTEFSELELSGENVDLLDKDLAYDARIVNYMNGTTSFYIDRFESETSRNLISQKITSLIQTQPVIFNITKNKYEAQYIVISDGECVTITGNSIQQYPVWRVNHDQIVIDRLVKAMTHISKWEYVKSYDNPDIPKGQLCEVDFHLELVHSNHESMKLPIVRDRVQFEYRDGIKLRIRLDNKSEEKYYCALLYLSNTFAVNANLLDGKVNSIPGKSSTWALNGNGVSVTIEDHVINFRKPASLSYIKIIASTNKFEIDAMEQSGLPEPKPDCLDNKHGLESTRGLEVKTVVEEIKWFTRTIELKVLNPNFNASDLENE